VRLTFHLRGHNASLRSETYVDVGTALLRVPTKEEKEYVRGTACGMQMSSRHPVRLRERFETAYSRHFYLRACANYIYVDFIKNLINLLRNENASF